MRKRFWLELVALCIAGTAPIAAGQTCGRPAAECAGVLHCGGEWDFENGFYFTGHALAGRCEGPPGGGAVSCVPADKWAHVANGWAHWASFPTWPTGGYWGTCSFNENKNCDNVYRGNRSQELTMTCANGVGVIYKTAAVPPQHRIRVEAYMKFTPNGDAPDVEHAIGIDPAGGTNPASAAVRWTAWQEHTPSPPQPAGVFNRGTADAVSLGTTITVFIRQRAFEPPCQGQTFMVDHVRVLDLGPDGPVLRVEPTALAAAVVVGTDAAPQTFRVSNSGVGTLTYVIAVDATWLSVAPLSGLASGETNEVVVTYATAGLPVGTHSATITVTSPEALNPPQTVTVLLTISTRPADLDGDGDVDLDDFIRFLACFSGPSRRLPDGCTVDADFDEDTDVDLDDFRLFQLCYNGANRPPGPNCP